MANIPLTEGFKVIDEGNYVFYIHKIDYDETFGKLKIHLVTADGQTHIEKYSLKNQDDSYNEGALNAFSYTAKTALNDFKRTDIDPYELVGHYIRADVIHNTVENRNTGKEMVFANLGQKDPAEGFEAEMSDKAKKIIEKSKPLDLDDIL